MYLTFEEYISLGGRAAEAAFSRLEFAAEKRLDYFTQCRLHSDIEQRECVKLLIFELIGLAEKSDLTAERTLSSVSNNGISTVFDPSIMSTDVGRNYIKAEELRLVRQYLSGEVDASGTPLLFVGVE